LRSFGFSHFFLDPPKPPWASTVTPPLSSFSGYKVSVPFFSGPLARDGPARFYFGSVRLIHRYCFFFLKNPFSLVDCPALLFPPPFSPLFPPFPCSFLPPSFPIHYPVCALAPPFLPFFLKMNPDSFFPPGAGPAFSGPFFLPPGTSCFRPRS